jgi:hypothetical protein
LLAAVPAQAHELITTKLTWTQEISRIFYRRCVGCHREGGPAPMALTDYARVRPWAAAIKEEVLERRMPPWGAVKGFGEFLHDPSLSFVEMDWIVNWVEGGAPEGDPIYLPPLPPPPQRRPPPAGARTLKLPAAAVEALRAVSIQPAGLAAGESMEVIAHRPDSASEHLIWIRNYKPAWNHTYVFREPLVLPKGTRIAVHAPAGASAVMSVLRARTRQVRSLPAQLPAKQ